MTMGQAQSTVRDARLLAWPTARSDAVAPISRRRPRRRVRFDGLRITKVGMWFLIFLGIVTIAATNTGNNGLYLVLATMAAVLVVSHFLAAANVRGLRVGLEAQGEIFAHRLTHLHLELANRSRWLPRWLVVVTVDPEQPEPTAAAPRRRSAPFLVPYLPAAARAGGQVEVIFRRRGRRRIGRAHVTSLYPLGFFRKGGRFPVDLELLVYPEIFPPASSQPEQTGKSGDEPTHRAGWGHELLGLRSFRHGDDPRAIHWKKTASSGTLIFQERETEENRRLLIVFDNAVGRLSSEAGRARFERLVSEAATAAVDYLDRGYEVGLLTRDGRLAFAAGRPQRRALLETLALIEPVAAATGPLQVPDTRSPHLRLAMAPEEAAA